jgi:hypothetical protein
MISQNKQNSLRVGGLGSWCQKAEEEEEAEETKWFNTIFSFLLVNCTR